MRSLVCLDCEHSLDEGYYIRCVLVAIAAAGALLAIPQTRAAILDLLRIGGVEVQRVETQPRAPVRPAALGREVSFATALRTVDFPLLSPSGSFTASACWYVAIARS